MIRELFEKDKPVFVRFERNGFRIGRMRRQRLRGVITDMQPMRKRFEARKVACWSADGITSRDGHRCCLCRDRWRCAQRVRLMMMLDEVGAELKPAILEIGHGSFDRLEAFLLRIAPGKINSAPVCIGLERDQGYLRFTFELAH
jgi:hypothetical protein